MLTGRSLPVPSNRHSWAAFATVAHGEKSRAECLPAWARRPCKDRNQTPFGRRGRHSREHLASQPTMCSPNVVRMGRPEFSGLPSNCWFFGLSGPCCSQMSLRLKLIHRPISAPGDVLHNVDDTGTQSSLPLVRHFSHWPQHQIPNPPRQTQGRTTVAAKLQ